MEAFLALTTPEQLEVYELCAWHLLQDTWQKCLADKTHMILALRDWVAL